MAYLIRDWFLEDEVYRTYSCEPKQNELQGLSKVNIFVGPNNSGKSRLLRELFEIMPHRIRPTGDLLENLNKLCLEFNEKVSDICSQCEIKGLYEKEELPRIITKDCIEISEKYREVPRNAINSFSRISEATVVRCQGAKDKLHRFAIARRKLPDIISIGSESLAKLNSIIDGTPEVFEFTGMYVPTLRGLRPFKDCGDIYCDRTLSDYFDTGSVGVFTGLEMYKQVKNLLLGDLQERERISEYQDFLSKNLFGREKVAIIPREKRENNEKKEILFVKVGAEKEREIYNLGDGIQQLLMLTFPLFAYEDKSLLLFIEEPELYLHPGYQRQLLKIYTSDEFADVQVFFTTHSNHFLDLTTDIEQISVYRFDKELDEGDSVEKSAKFTIFPASTGDTNLLDHLGVQNASVFLANCTIWVEGITDRLYIRKFLELYSEREDVEWDFREDTHYAFVEYSGNNISHWSFLEQEDKPMVVERVCNRLFLIADKDSGKEERHEKLKETLGDKFFLLDRKEIENILTPETIRKVIRDYEGEEVGLNDFEYEDYPDKPIGKFIEDEILKDGNEASKRLRSTSNKNDPHPYAEGNTIKAKVGFCKKAISHLKSYDDLSPDANEICTRIHKFIKENNPD